MYGLGFAVELIAEALDVIHTIGNDDVIARQHPLHGRIFLRARILLGFGSVVDITSDAEGLIVDEMHIEPIDARIGAGS